MNIVLTNLFKSWKLKKM